MIAHVCIPELRILRQTTMNEIQACRRSTVRSCFKSSKRKRSKEAFERGSGYVAWYRGLVWHMRTQLPSSALKAHLTGETMWKWMESKCMGLWVILQGQQTQSVIKIPVSFSECLKWNSFHWTLCLGKFFLLKDTIMTIVVVTHLKYILRVSPSAKHGLSGGVSP